MARAFYSYEVGDPDLDWLISNFLGEHPDFLPIESDNLPIVLITQADELWELPEEEVVSGETKAGRPDEDRDEVA